MKTKVILLIGIIFSYCSHSFSQTTFHSLQTGDWHQASTWAEPGVPGVGDSVVIESSHIVSVDSGTVQVKGMYVKSGSDLQLTGNANFQTTGTIQNYGQIDITDPSGSVQFNDIFNHTTGIIQNTAGEDIIINGNVFNNGSFTVANGIVYLNGVNKTIEGDSTIDLESVFFNGSYTNNHTDLIIGYIAGTNSSAFIQGENAMLTFKSTADQPSQYFHGEFLAHATGNTVRYAYGGIPAYTYLFMHRPDSSGYYNLEIGTNDHVPGTFFVYVTTHYEILISNQLKLTKGILFIASSSTKVTLEETASFSGGSDEAFVIFRQPDAFLKKQFSSMPTVPITFPVGYETASDEIYAPVTLSFHSGEFNSDNYIGVNLALLNEIHPALEDTVNYLNRYGILSAQNIENPDFDLTFSYDDSFVEGDESSIVGVMYNPSDDSWYQGSLADTSTNSILINDASFFGEFTGGCEGGPQIINCPKNIAVYVSPDSSKKVVNWLPPTALPHCSSLGQSFQTHNPGDLFPIGMSTVEYTYVNIENDSSTCSFDVHVIDTISPILNCPGDTTLHLAPATCHIRPNEIPFIASDNSNVFGDTIYTLLPNYTRLVLGVNDITILISDSSGNTASCSYQATVIDTVPPTYHPSCPDTIFAYVDEGECETQVHWFGPFISDNCGVDTSFSNYVSGDIFSVGSHTVIYQAEDIFGNVSQCVFQVEVLDTSIASILCPSNITTYNGYNNCHRFIAWNAIVPDLSFCDYSDFSSNYTSPDYFDVGTTEVIYTLSDVNGNESSCSFDITIVDGQAPTYTSCPSDITVSSDTAFCGAIVYWTEPVGMDNCPDLLLTVKSHEPGDTFALGTTEVTYQFIDSINGLSATCQFDVTVLNQAGPSFDNCPGNINLNVSSGACESIVNWPDVLVSETCNPISSLTNTHSSGAVFELGTTSVVYTATDTVGNTSVCSFDVTITESVDPAFTNCPSNMTLVLGSNQCDTTITWVEPTASDSCSGISSLVKTHNPGDSFNTGITNVVYTATDSSGNTSICSFQIEVLETELPLIICPADTTVYLNENSCYASVVWTEPVSSDNCAYSVTSNYASGDSLPVGNNLIEYTATDASGNSASCQFTVQVVDTISPSIQCIENQIVAANASCEATVSWTEPIISDNCNLQSITSSHASGSTFSLDTTEVTYTAMDSAGNISVCSFLVIVRDSTPPVMTNCPSDISFEISPGNCDTSITWSEPLTTDVCGNPVSISSNYSSGSIFPLGITEVIYTAMDAYGNTSTCSFSVSVNNNTPITVLPGSCPSDIPYTCSPIVAWNNPDPDTISCERSIFFTSTMPSGSPFPVGQATTVHIIANDAFRSDTVCEFTVNRQPLPDADAGADATICFDDSVIIGGNPTAMGGISFDYQYVWHPADGLSATNVSNPIASPEETTTYTVFAIETMSGCASTAQVEVRVTDRPEYLEVEQGIENHPDATTTNKADQWGYSVANIGDVNGDGIVDVAIGVPFREYAGVSGKDFGGVDIGFLNVDGSIDSIQKIGVNEGNFTGTIDSKDFFGSSVAGLGDLDGDGIPDIAVGATGDDDDDNNKKSNKGAVWILFLHSNGTVKSHQKISDTEGNFSGDLSSSKGDFFGGSVAAIDDVDGDGVVDLAVGAYKDDDGGTDRGAVWLLFLHSNGTVKSHQKIGMNDGGLSSYVTLSKDWFGYSLTGIGDIDGDSVPDIAVGAPLSNVGGKVSIGAAYVIRLHSTGTVKDVSVLNHLTTGLSSQLKDSYDHFGRSLAAVDFNLDGIKDLGVGAPQDDDYLYQSQQGIDRGAVYVLYIDSVGGVTQTNKISASVGGLPEDVLAGDHVAFSLTPLSDFSGNCVPGFIAGAPLDDGIDMSAGSVWTLFLKDAVTNPLARIASSSKGVSNETLYKKVDEASAGDVDFIIYPNPVENHLFIHISSISQNIDNNVHVALYDFMGREVYTSDNQVNRSHLIAIDVSGQAEGKYVLQITTEQGVPLYKHILLK